MHSHRIEITVSLKWRHSTDHVIENNPQTIDIGSVIDILNVDDLLRRHIGGCTHHLSGYGLTIKTDTFGDPKIE